MGDWSISITLSIFAVPLIALWAPALSFEPYSLRLRLGMSVWLISVDLPDPLTPVTHTSPPSGIFTSMFFRLFSRQPFSSMQDFSTSTGRRCVGVTIAYSPVRYLIVTLWVLDRTSGSGPAQTRLPPWAPAP